MRHIILHASNGETIGIKSIIETTWRVNAAYVQSWDWDLAHMKKRFVDWGLTRVRIESEVFLDAIYAGWHTERKLCMVVYRLIKKIPSGIGEGVNLKTTVT